MRVSSSKTWATWPNRDINGLNVVFHNSLSVLYSHSLLSQSLCSSPISTLRWSLLFVNLCSSSSISTLRHRCWLFNHNFASSSSSTPSLRFDLSISSLRFSYLWNCYLLLFLFFGFVDLLILFFRNQTLVFDICISVEIKADCHTPKPNLTQLVAIRGQRQVWNFSTRFDRVSF